MGVAYHVVPYIYTTESRDGVTWNHRVTGNIPAVVCWLHSQGQFMDSGRLCGWLQPQLQCSLETTSACSANKVSSHPRTLHSISLTDNHAHMLTGDKVTGPYVYACSVIVPPQTETLHYPPCIIVTQCTKTANQLASRERLSFVLRHHELVPRQIQWHSLRLVFWQFIYLKILKLDTSPTHKVVQLETHKNFECVSSGLY